MRSPGEAFSRRLQPGPIEMHVRRREVGVRRGHRCWCAAEADHGIVDLLRANEELRRRVARPTTLAGLRWPSDPKYPGGRCAGYRSGGAACSPHREMTSLPVVSTTSTPSMNLYSTSGERLTRIMLYTGRSGRGGTRQGLRLAPDAAPSGVRGSVQEGRGPGPRFSPRQLPSSKFWVRCSPRWRWTSIWLPSRDPPRPPGTLPVLRSLRGLAQIALLSDRARVALVSGLSNRTRCSGRASTRCSTCAATSWLTCRSLDIAFFDHNPVGRLVTRVTTDVDALNELFAAGW